MLQRYQLHDFCVHVLSDNAAVQHLLRRTLQFKGAQRKDEEVSPAADAAEVTLDLSADRDPTSPPDDAHYIDMTGHPGLGVWRTSRQMILRHEDTTINLYPQTGVAEAKIPADLFTSGTDPWRSSLLPYLVSLSLAILLRAQGWFPLHAAGLARGRRGALLTACSGSGKTTTALSLVRSGWGYLSDDTVLLRLTAGQVRAYSFRRDFCVDPSLAAHFPELSGVEWPFAPANSAKWRVNPGQIFPGQSAATCTPSLVVLPTLADASESHVEPVGPKLALEQLLNQGGFFLAPGSDAADRHLAVLRQLIGQAHTYRFHAGRDVLEDPRTVHALLAPLLTDPLAPRA